MLSGSEEVLEVGRWLFMALLAAQWAGSVESVHQFTIHRMQHIDVGSTSFGARLHAAPSPQGVVLSVCVRGSVGGALSS